MSVNIARNLASAMRRTIAALLVIVALHTSVFAEVFRAELNTVYKYYEIEGATREEIYDQTRKLGPVLSNGDRVDAVKSDRIFWKLFCRSGRKSFAINIDSFGIEVTITLPKWKAPKNASKKLRNDWKRYMQEVKHHELVHRDISYSWARSFLRALKFLGSAMCSADGSMKPSGSISLTRFRIDEAPTHFRVASPPWSGSTTT